MKKVMLVDDQEMANFIVKKMMEIHMADTEVRDFTDPVKAFKSLPDEAPHLILLDLNMPVMNGWDFLEEMKAQEIQIPVIILTSSTSAQDLEKSKAYSNVQDFYHKPMQKETFSEIKALLNN